MSHQQQSDVPPSKIEVALEPSVEFLSHCYRNALDQLSRSFASGRPLAIMIGEGQSTPGFVIQTFLSGLDNSTVVARVREPCANATDLMREIVSAAGFQPKDMSLTDLEAIFKMFLAFQKSHDRRTLVCLEETQNSEWWVLDKIRKLVELEVEGQYGMMILIAGQPALKELLVERPLSGIAALAGYRISLAPFSLTETTECIRQRVESTGALAIGDVFQYQAITLIHELCAGVPDAVNALVCDSLAMADREGVSLVTMAIVKRAYEASRAAMDVRPADPNAETVAIDEVRLPMQRLFVRMSDDQIREQALRQGHTLIGRSHLCDIQVDSSVVSRHHALINYSEGGAVLIDLGSRNGTFVDGRRVTAHELVNGEQIQVGNCKIEFVDDDELHASFAKAAQSAGIAIGSRILARAAANK